MTSSESHHNHAHALDPAKVGMVSFLITEVAFFGTLIMTYVFYLEKTRADARAYLELPLTILGSICLFSSSYTIHLALKKLEHDDQLGFSRWLGLTILLGVVFLLGTAKEWYDLIVRRHVWIDSSMFGTTYFTLVGFHAFHVSIGLLLMTVVYGCALQGRVAASHLKPVDMVSWYWHFVDAVWVVVFSLVYFVGR